MPEKKTCLIFLSWQSDRKDCRKFINSVMDELTQKANSLVNIALDRDTVNVPGAPDIGDTIFEKIDHCDLYIADITLINDKDSNYRRTPNPNVMIELGYAIKTLSWERIILLQCKDYGDIEELPFDINHRRIINYTVGIDSENSSKKKKESQKDVVYKINNSINLLLEKNLLFGGKKCKVPKFEIKLKQSSETMKDLVFEIKNVSSIMVSDLASMGLYVDFSNKLRKPIEGNPIFISTSLNPGEKTVVKLQNNMLGAGKGYNNAVWHNIDFHWQFCCKDEEGTEFAYEMNKHIDRADYVDNLYVSWPNRYIG